MSQHQNLEDEARETIRQYIWWDTETWALGEGIDRLAHYTRLMELRRLDEIGAVIGEDRVRAMWSELWDDILVQTAEMARKVVPSDVVDDWLVGQKRTRPFVTPNGVIYCTPESFASPPPEKIVDEINKMVRAGLRRVMVAILLECPVEEVK